MPRKSICIPCHKKTTCTAPIHMHVRGMKERVCSYCGSKTIAISCASVPGVTGQTMHPATKKE